MKKTHHKHKLIFIVEDNEMYSFMLDYMLSQEHKLRCIRFDKGEECIDSLKLNPDMIILDYVLPGINGLETYRKIKMTKPEVPVVILTGHYDASAAQEFLKEGVYDYMLKEENAVNTVKALVENVMDQAEEEKIQEKERWTQREVLRYTIGFIAVLAALACIAWFISH
ncbi:MAG TPA: response regulator [Bacteroidia bacterium]|nr:response regulator [Bacteroidia bacterium]